MGIFDSISELFFSENDPSGYKEVVKNRKKTKEKFSKQLKTQLYLSDEETKAVISIIEEHEKKMDLIKDSYDYQNDNPIDTERMLKALFQEQLLMKQEVEEIIKFIMRKKINKANARFGGNF